MAASPNTYSTQLCRGAGPNNLPCLCGLNIQELRADSALLNQETQRCSYTHCQHPIALHAQSHPGVLIDPYQLSTVKRAFFLFVQSSQFHQALLELVNHRVIPQLDVALRTEDRC